MPEHQPLACSCRVNSKAIKNEFARSAFETAVSNFQICVDALEIKQPCFARGDYVSELCMRLLQLDLGEDLATRGERFWKAIMDPVSHHV